MSSHLLWAYPGLPVSIPRSGLGGGLRSSPRAKGAAEHQAPRSWGPRDVCLPCALSLLPIPVASLSHHLPSPAPSTAITNASVTRPGWALPLLCHQRKLEKPQASGTSSTQAWAGFPLTPPQQLPLQTCPGSFLWAHTPQPGHPRELSPMDLPAPTSAPQLAHLPPGPAMGTRSEAELGVRSPVYILHLHSPGVCVVLARALYICCQSLFY